MYNLLSKGIERSSFWASPVAVAWSLSSADVLYHCTFPLEQIIPATHFLHWEGSSKSSIVSIFHSLLFPLLCPCCWQQRLYRLVTALWLTYFVSVLFCVMRSWEPTLGPRQVCQPLSICRFSWEELSAFERFSSKLLRDWHPLEVVPIVTISC